MTALSEALHTEEPKGDPDAEIPPPAEPVTKYGGDPLTIADLQGVGVYQFWYDKQTNTLQVMTGVA